MTIRRSLLLLACALAGCNASESPGGDGSAGPFDDAAAPADLAAPSDGPLAVDAGATDLRIHAGTYLLRLDAGAFPPTPSHPSALVYVPEGFDPTPPLAVFVYLHGWNNCVENVVRDAGASCDPDAGTPARSAYALAAQLEASRRNAILLCPEVMFDAPSGNPGSLGTAGGFRALLDEVLRDLAPAIGPRTLADVGQVALASHSGGYQAAAAIATKGGIEVIEIDLLDSLYGNSADFEAWIKKDLASFAGSTPARRFADVYTQWGGTITNSQNMADRAADWVGRDAGVLVDDRTTSTWPDETYRHGLLFKLSGLSHDGVPRYYVGKLLATGALPGKR